MRGVGAWWRDAVVYQVYPRSFTDSDDDGEGDLRGVRSRLTYLEDLGVDAIWLSPFYPSPMVDGGYDVADYCDIDPRFGTLADFDALVADAGRRGIRIIVDLVPNHCSSDHPWFQEALRAAPGSTQRERFIFRDQPNNWQSHFGGPAWTQVPDGQWYLHLFDSAQPDWNWRHPDVVAMFERVLRFWLDRGVAAFRVDVANALFKDPELPDVPSGTVKDDQSVPFLNQPEVHDLYRSWRKILAAYPSDVFPGQRGAIGEAWFDGPDTARPYLSGDGLPQLFNFLLIQTPWTAADLRATIDISTGLNGSVPWALGNHDVVRIASRLGVDQSRMRLSPQEVINDNVTVDEGLGMRRARMAALLLLALPGSAYIYQGDELGLPEVMDIPADRRQDPTYRRTAGAIIGRDGCRVPLPWHGGTPPYGFADHAVRTWLPQPDDWATLTAKAQDGQPESMLTLYRAALRERRRHPALGDGIMTWAEAGESVLVFTREPGFTFAANLGDKPARLLAHDRVLLASGPLDGGRLPPDTAVWLDMTP